jgi:hypothetical protein
MKTPRVKTDSQQPSATDVTFLAFVPDDAPKKAEPQPHSNEPGPAAAASKRMAKTKSGPASTDTRNMEKPNGARARPSDAESRNGQAAAVPAPPGGAISVFDDSATETLLEQARREIAALNLQMHEISTERNQERARATDLQAVLDRRTAEWIAQSEQAAKTKADFDNALTGLKEEVATLERYGKWAGEQIALLVEKEAAAAAEREQLEGDLTGLRAELAAARARLAGADNRIHAAEAALRERDEDEAALRDGAIRHLGREFEQTTPIAEIIAVVYRRQRELERELDQEIAKLQQVHTALEGWERSSYAGTLRYGRRLFAKRQLLRALPNALRNAL